MSLNLDTYKFDTIPDGSTSLWRTAGVENRIGPNGLSQIVVGVNLREEIIKRWGSVDTERYTYTFAFQLRRTKNVTPSGLESVGHMIGCGTVNKMVAANQPKTNLGDGQRNRRIYERENSGIFVASAYYSNDPALFQAGVVQSRKYQGVFNSNYQQFRNVTYDNDFSYYYDFCNNGNGIGASENSSMVNNRFWPLKRWGRIFSDLGNTSSISLANEGTEYFDLTPDVLTSKTTYFWMRLGVQPQGLQSGANCETGRPPLRSRSSNPRTCHTNNGSPVIFFGKSNSPYFDVIDNLPNAPVMYPSVDVIGNTNNLQAAVVVPASFARPQFATTGSDTGGVTNPYYEEEFGFNAVGTIIFRTKQFREQDWPAGADYNFYSQFQWFSDAGVNFSRDPGEGYRTPYAIRIPEHPQQVYNVGWGFNLYVMAKYRNYKMFTDRLPATSLAASPLWDFNSKNINFFPADKEIISAVRGVGNYLALSTREAAQCINMNICTPSVNDLTPTKCTTTVNARDCTQNPGSETDVQYLGWDIAPYKGAYCVRNPNDVLCGCTNTINDENITDFNRLLKETIGIEVPNYCWADACTAQATQAWLDPTIDPNACPSDLTFCIAVLDLAGDNNTIKNTDIYQRCVRDVADSGDSGAGRTVSNSTIWIVIGVVAGIIILGLILFFIFRRKTPAPVPT